MFHSKAVKSRETSRKTLLYFSIILIGANLRAPITGLGPVLPEIQNALQMSGAAAGLLNGLPLMTFAVLSLCAPMIGRLFGLERTLGFSLVLIFVGTVLRSLDMAGAIWAGTIVLSLGIALGNVLLPGLVKREFPAAAPKLIGAYVASMAGLAGLSAGIAFPLAHISGSSWRWAIGVWAALSALTAMIWLPQIGASDRLTKQSEPYERSKSPWLHPIGWQVSIFFALQSAIFYSLIAWFASYAQSFDIALRVAGFYLMAHQIVAVAGNLFSSSIIRRFDNQVFVGIGCGLFLLIGTTGILLFPSLSLIWLIVAGLGAGVALVTNLTLFGLRTRDHHQANALSGMAQSIGYAGAAAGPFLFGLLHDSTGSWEASMSLLIAASFFVMVFGALSGRARLI